MALTTTSGRSSDSASASTKLRRATCSPTLTPCTRTRGLDPPRPRRVHPAAPLAQRREGLAEGKIVAGARRQPPRSPERRLPAASTDSCRRVAPDLGLARHGESPQSTPRVSILRPTRYRVGAVYGGALQVLYDSHGTALGSVSVESRMVVVPRGSEVASEARRRDGSASRSFRIGSEGPTCVAAGHVWLGALAGAYVQLVHLQTSAKGSGHPGDGCPARLAHVCRSS